MTASAIIRFSYNNCDLIYNESDYDQYVPMEFKSLARFPEVERTDGGYVVTLYASHYLPERMMGSTPTRWDLHRHTIVMGPSGYTMEQGDSISTVRASRD